MAYFTKYICFYKLDESNTLLLNTLTSAIDIVDNDTLTKIQNMIEEKEQITVENDSDLYNALKKRGYIFESENEQSRIINTLREINNKTLSETVNTQFTICPTMGCNLRCTYCFKDSKERTNFKIMSKKQLETIFKYIAKCHEKIKEKIKKDSENYKKEFLSPRISLFGGEPLLKSNYKIIEKILEFAEQICIPVAIVTNGTTMDDDWFKLFEKYKKFMLFQITIDGNKAVHDIRRIRADGSGTFEKICENVDKILEIGMNLHLRINIDSANINNIMELKEIFDKRSWSKNEFFTPYASPVRCFKSGNAPENILTDSEILDVFMDKGWYGKEDSFFKSLVSPVFGVVTQFFEINNKVKPWKKTYCEGTFGGNYCFTPDGTVTTCLTCVGNENYGIGKFDEEDVKIDENKLNMWTKRDAFEMQKCNECKFALFCGGGCPINALETYGDINCPVCDDIEKTLEVYIKHTKDKFLKQEATV